jgi:hypothetical protein
VLAEWEAVRTDVICALRNQNLERVAVLPYIDTLPLAPVTRDAVTKAWEATLDNGQWATWIAVGALIDTPCPCTASDFTLPILVNTEAVSTVSGTYGIPLTMSGVQLVNGNYQVSIGNPNGNQCIALADIQLSGYTPWPSCDAGVTRCDSSEFYCTYTIEPHVYTQDQTVKYLAFNSTTPFSVTLTVNSVTTI